MSLREEIKKTVREKTFPSFEEIVDITLSEVEKRIDSRKQDLENGTCDVFDEVERIKELEEIKEMLKE